MCKQFRNFRGGQVNPKPTFNILGSDRDGRITGFEWIFIHEPRRNLTARPFCHELQSASYALFRQSRMYTARETEGSFGRKIMLLGGFSDVDEVPRRSFKQDIRRASTACTGFAHL